MSEELTDAKILAVMLEGISMSNNEDTTVEMVLSMLDPVEAATWEVDVVARLRARMADGSSIWEAVMTELVN